MADSRKEAELKLLKHQLLDVAAYSEYQGRLDAFDILLAKKEEDWVREEFSRPMMEAFPKGAPRLLVEGLAEEPAASEGTQGGSARNVEAELFLAQLEVDREGFHASNASVLDFPQPTLPETAAAPPPNAPANLEEEPSETFSAAEDS